MSLSPSTSSTNSDFRSDEIKKSSSFSIDSILAHQKITDQSSNHLYVDMATNFVNHFIKANVLNGKSIVTSTFTKVDSESQDLTKNFIDFYSYMNFNNSISSKNISPSSSQIEGILLFNLLLKFSFHVRFSSNYVLNRCIIN